MRVVVLKLGNSNGHSVLWCSLCQNFIPRSSTDLSAENAMHGIPQSLIKKNTKFD